MVHPSLAAEDSADRLEWACMTDSRRYLAWSDVVGQLRLAVSEDEAVATYREPADGISEEEAVATYREPADDISEEERPYIEPYETMLTDWVEVFAYRTQACGPDDAYPFILTGEGIELRDSVSPAYVFQLLVSLGSVDDHHDGTTVYKLFEELSAEAAGRYLGDTRTTVVFGWPRLTLPRGFRDAVTSLLGLLREGEAREDREGLGQSKDDGLDIVAWREFPDRRASKLILFGQCAAGRRWREKARDLRADDWCKNNLTRPFAVNPIPAFFVPRALSEKDANYYGVNQILLDRCRISALCSGSLARGLDERLREWIEAAVERGIEFDAD